MIQEVKRIRATISRRENTDMRKIGLKIKERFFFIESIIKFMR